MGKKRTDEELAALAKKYTTLKEFCAKEPSAYSIICQRKLGDKLFSHMKLGHARKRTEEELAKVAAKYDNIHDFIANDYQTYAVIEKRGLYDKLCGHMKRSHRARFTEEELAEIASKYRTLKEFKKNDPSALVTIRTRGLFDKLCSHLILGHARKRSDKELAEIASKYDNTKDFIKNDKIVYTTISARGLMNKLCGHMRRLNGNNKVSEEELAKISSRYNDLKEFREKERTAYKHICERKLYRLLDHMDRKVVYYSYKELSDIASRYDTLSVFRKEQKRVYDAIRSHGLLKKLCGHMKRGKGGVEEGYVPRKPYTNEELFEIASKYKSIKDFSKNDASALATIRKRGLFIAYCGNMKSRKRWTIDALRQLTLDYDNIHNLREDEPGAYNSILKRGLLEELCSHMKRETNRYTYEELAEVAKKYHSLKEFREREAWAYKAMQNRGLLQKLCGHMVHKGGLISRKIYAFTFNDGYAYIGLTLNPERRFRQHTTNGKNPSSVYLHIKETGASYQFKVLTDWLNVKESGKAENYYIKQYASKGWKMLNRQPGGGLGGATGKLYTDKRIRAEVAKYEYLRDFRKGSPNFYRYIINHHLQTKYCKNLRRTIRHWDLDEAVSIAQKCRSRWELSKEYYGAYKLLKEAGLLDKYLPKRNRWSNRSPQCS